MGFCRLSNLWISGIRLTGREYVIPDFCNGTGQFQRLDEDRKKDMNAGNAMFLPPPVIQ